VQHAIRLLNPLVDGYEETVREDPTAPVTAIELRARYARGVAWHHVALLAAKKGMPPDHGDVARALRDIDGLVQILQVVIQPPKSRAQPVRRCDDPRVHDFAKQLDVLALIVQAGLRVNLLPEGLAEIQEPQLPPILPLRAKFALACFHCEVAAWATRQKDVKRVDCELERAWDLLTDATDEPSLHQWAASDPSLQPLRDSEKLRSEFQKEYGAGPHAASVSHGSLARLHVVGAHAAALGALKAPITTTHKLLDETSTAESRAELAMTLKVSESTVARWHSAAVMIEEINDLDVGGVNLLLACGIATAAELGALKDARALHQRVKDANIAQPELKDTPSTSVVARWMADAKAL
jgi:hypothetical protein